MKVTHKVTIPASTCHPGANVEFGTQVKPFPTWNCAKCESVIAIEKNPPTISPQ